MASKYNNRRGGESHSNFLNTSVNYSEVDLLKIKTLKPILESCNESNIKSLSKANVFDKDRYLVPNNDNKYYLLVTNKGDNRYKTLYFFPKEFKENTRSDFFMEIDNNRNCNLPKRVYLFEGYIYNQGSANGKKYMITDVLYIENKPIDNKYSLRLNIFREIILNANLNDLNNSLSIMIHPIFKIKDIEDEQLYIIMKNNFVYKKEICSKEYICDYKKVNNKDDVMLNACEIKNICCTKYIDVYTVRNIDTNNDEGILYISSIEISKKMTECFKNKDIVLNIKCKYNNKFKKWEPLICGVSCVL